MHQIACTIPHRHHHRPLAVQGDVGRAHLVLRGERRANAAPISCGQVIRVHRIAAQRHKVEAVSACGIRGGAQSGGRYSYLHIGHGRHAVRTKHEAGDGTRRRHHNVIGHSLTILQNRATGLARQPGDRSLGNDVVGSDKDIGQGITSRPVAGGRSAAAKDAAAIQAHRRVRHRAKCAISHRSRNHAQPKVSYVRYDYLRGGRYVAAGPAMVSGPIGGVGVVTAQWHKLKTILAQGIRGRGKVRRTG